MTPFRHPLFEVKVGTTWRSPFVYASWCVPLPDRKSFVPPHVAEHNRQFNELNGYKPGIQISPGARWPDFLKCGGAYVSFFVSERVVNDIREGGFELLDATEFPIERIEDDGEKRRRVVRLEEAPRYFVIEAPGELIPDWERMNIPLDAAGRPTISYARMPSPFLYRMNTWTGRDLFAAVGHSTHLFCSERFKYFGKARKWTNVVFDGIGWHAKAGEAGCGIG